MITQILLDIDGVLGDWDSAALRLIGREDLIGNTPEKVHASKAVLDTDETWRAIKETKGAFWLSIQPYPWAEVLHRRLSNIANVTIASSPGHDRHALTPKAQWVDQYISPRAPTMFGKEKFLMANEWTVLIDDLDKNISAFKSARPHPGHAIVFPQLWNSAQRIEQDPVEYIVSEIYRLIGEEGSQR